MCQCDGWVDVLACWTFSGVFEEQGVVKTPVYGGFGLLAAVASRNRLLMPSSSFTGWVGDQRFELESDRTLLTRRKDVSLVLAVWNDAPPDQAGAAKTVTLRLQRADIETVLNFPAGCRARGFPRGLQKMSPPRYPSEAQIQRLTKAAKFGPFEARRLRNAEFTLTLPAYGLAVIEPK